MADNKVLPPTGTGTADIRVATDEVTHSGDVAQVSLVRVVQVTGAEGSKTPVDLHGLGTVQTTTWDNTTADDTTLTVNVTGFLGAVLAFKSDGGTITAGVMRFQGSLDGGSTYQTISAVDMSSQNFDYPPRPTVVSDVQLKDYRLSGNFDNTIFVIPGNGCTHIQVRLFFGIAGTQILTLDLYPSNAITETLASAANDLSYIAVDSDAAIAPWAKQLNVGGHDGTNSRMLKLTTARELVVAQPTAANLKTEVSQGTAASLKSEVQGPAATGAAVSGNPVVAAGRANATVPSAVDAGDVVPVWASLAGALKVEIVDQDGDTAMDATNNALKVNVVASSASGGTEYTEDAALPGNPIGTMLIARQESGAPTDQLAANGDAIALQATEKGELYVKHADVIAAALAAGDNNIGNVDVVTVPADPFGANADAASATGSISAKLRSIAAVQLPAALAANGGLKVEGVAGGVAVPVSLATLPALTAGTAEIGKLAAGTANIGDVDVLTLPALVAGTANIGDVDVLTVPADPFGANADAASITGSISAKLKALLVEASTINSTSSDGGTALTSTAQAIKASAGTLLGYYIYNPNATAQFVQFYNTASGSVTVGTTSPLFMLTIPATSAANLWMQPSGIAFGTAMSWAATSTAAGNGAPGSSLDAVAWYK